MKKLLCVLMAAVFAVAGLAGCSKSDEGESESKSPCRIGKTGFT